MKTYFIGGSPCSGKSTVAEMLSEKYGFYYYKLGFKSILTDGQDSPADMLCKVEAYFGLKKR